MAQRERTPQIVNILNGMRGKNHITHAMWGWFTRQGFAVKARRP